MSSEAGKANIFEIAESNVKATIVSETVQSAGYTDIVIALQSFFGIFANIVSAQFWNGVGWYDMTQYAGSCGLQYLKTNSKGYQHVFKWDSAADLFIDASNSVKVRFKVSDGARETSYVESETFIIDHRPTSPDVINPVNGIFQASQTVEYLFRSPVCVVPAYLEFVVEVDDEDTFMNPTEIDSTLNPEFFTYDDPTLGWSAWPVGGLDSELGQVMIRVVQANLSPDTYYARAVCMLSAPDMIFCGQADVYTDDGFYCGMEY